MASIFIVDDDHDILLSLNTWFTFKAYQVKTFQNGKDLLPNIVQYKPDLVLLDVMLQGEDGRFLCRDIKEQAHYPVKVLLFSANPMALLSYQYDYADGIINKPYDLVSLEAKCRKLINTKHKWYE